MRRLMIAACVCGLGACDAEPAAQAIAVAPAAAQTLPQARSGAAAPRTAEVRPPRTQDLLAYTRGIEGKGPLQAKIVTNLGAIDCELFEDSAPMTVANFVGLARGLHPWLDAATRRVVTGRPFYDGVTFHRVVASFVIQAGDREGTGRGGPGYKFANEIDTALEFDRPGRLAMANAGPDTNGSQFFISLGKFPHLNGAYTIFGQCDTPTVQRIGSVGTQVGTATSEKSLPTTPVVIQEIRLRRGDSSARQ